MSIRVREDVPPVAPSGEETVPVVPVPPPAISVRGLTKTYRRASGTTVNAVDDLSLETAEGELVAVVGPSGCGKTTLLRCIAGLERPTSGEVDLGGKLVSADGGRKQVFVPPEHRGVGMMFQTYALWPHMSIANNVGYPLKCQGVPRKLRRARVDAVLAKVGLEGLQNEQPSRLSGGQQQRVALARCLVAEPSVILFDEPLSNVDAKVREELRLELVRMHKDTGFAGMYVTHDQDDALQLCDRLVVLNEGKIEQDGPPETVYGQPKTLYVAEFVGTVNRLEGQIVEQRGSASVRVGTSLGEIEATSNGSDVTAGDVWILVRPHHLRIVADTDTVRTRLDEASGNRWSGEIVVRMFRGSWVQYLVMVGSTPVHVWSDDHSLAEGTGVFVSVEPSNVLVRPMGDA